MKTNKKIINFLEALAPGMARFAPMTSTAIPTAPTDTPTAQPPNVHNGTYTVTHPEKGHFTVKLYTVQDGDMAGKRIVALLVGPDNQHDFRGVAFWDDAAQRVNTWKRYRSLIRTQPIDGYTFGEKWNATEQKLATWADLVIRGATEERHGYWWVEGCRLLLEGRCVVCNRPLTDPVSIQLGIGPTCRGEK